MQPSRERIFNVPTIIVLTCAMLVLVHAVLYVALDDRQADMALIVFAFWPMRYDLDLLSSQPWWIGWGPALWTFVTYAFIHGNLSHLFFNMVWLLAFGTPVARRFGSTRFVVFFLATAAVGALVYLIMNPGLRAPVVGASAAISGTMAAAIRFAFQSRGPLGALGGGDPEAYRVPVPPLATALRDFRVLAFIAVWFGVNLLFGLGTLSMPGVEESVAWEAHIGGFLAGLFGFALFDPVEPASAAAADEPAADDTMANPTESISENDKP